MTALAKVLMPFHGVGIELAHSSVIRFDGRELCIEPTFTIVRSPCHFFFFLHFSERMQFANKTISIVPYIFN